MVAAVGVSRVAESSKVQDERFVTSVVVFARGVMGTGRHDNS